MSDYQTLNKPGVYKEPHSKNEEAVLPFTHHGRGKTTGQKQEYNNNG